MMPFFLRPCLSELSLMSCSADDGVTNPIVVNVHSAPNIPISDDRSPLLVGRDNRAAIARQGKVTMAALYAIQVFYSFFIM